MGGKEVLKQSFETLLAKFAPEMRHLEQIVQVVDRGADGADISQLLLGRLQVLLDFLELCEALPNVLVKLVLYLIGDCEQLLVNFSTNGVKAVAHLHGQARNCELQSTSLLLAPRLELALDLDPEIEKALADTIRSLLPQLAFNVTQALSHVGG